MAHPNGGTPMNIAARNATFAVVLTALGAGAAFAATQAPTGGTTTGTSSTATTTSPTGTMPGKPPATAPGTTTTPGAVMPNSNTYAPQNPGATGMPNANTYAPSTSNPSASTLPSQSGCPPVAGTNGCMTPTTPTSPTSTAPRPSPTGTAPTACPNGQTPPAGSTTCPQ